MHLDPEHVEDTLTFPRYFSLVKYWTDHPPTHQLLAAYIGYEKPEKGDLGDLMADFGVGANLDGR